ncbi:MAG: hypothetical protein AB7G21_11295 [Dehalococcoidia bacterium]
MFPALPRTARLLPLALLATLLLACTREPAIPKSPASATPTEESVESLRARIRANALPNSAPSPTPAPWSEPALRPPALPNTVEALSARRGDVIGWFSEPRIPANPQTRLLRWDPASAFTPPPSKGDVRIYDLEAGIDRNLGIGFGPTFSPGKPLLVWTTTLEWPGEVLLYDPAVDQTRRLGPGRAARWVGPDHVRVTEQGNGEVVYQVRASQPLREPPREWGAPDVIERAGVRLESWRRDGSTALYPFDYETVRTTRLADARVFVFEAMKVILTGTGEIVLATMPVPDANVPGRADGYRGEFTSNLFLVNPATGEATFLATARLDSSPFPLVADARFVIWRDRACHPNATTWLYDRRTSSLNELTLSGWPIEFTPSGLLAAGTFGPTHLIDLETLTIIAWIPGEPHWSDDYRYAAVGGQYGAHGAWCESYVGP